MNPLYAEHVSYMHPVWFYSVTIKAEEKTIIRTSPIIDKYLNFCFLLLNFQVDLFMKAGLY